MSHKNKNQSKNRKIWLIFIPVVLSLVLIGGFYASYRRNTTQPTNIVTGPSDAEIQSEKVANAKAKKDLIERPSTAENLPNTPAQQNVQLTAKQEANGSVTVISKLYGVVYGTCNMTITNAGKSLSQTAIVIYQPEFSSCAGFNVPINNLGGGVWEIRIAISNSNASPESSITLKVN